MQNLDIEFGFPVGRRLAGKSDIQASEIPGGKVATCLYTGPYSEIEPAYNALSQWIKDNGYEATGVACEMYLNDPAQTPPPRVEDSNSVFTENRLTVRECKRLYA